MDRIELIRGVAREYVVATIARDALLEALGANPGLLTDRGMEKKDLDSLQAKLELTYLIRMFAVFETGLLEYWKNGLGKRSRPGASALIDSLSSKRKIFSATTARVHEVRRYRNKLVHEEDAQDAPPVNLVDALNFLCRFLGFLPEDW